jgi:hypothetical protein
MALGPSHRHRLSPTPRSLRLTLPAPAPTTPERTPYRGRQPSKSASTTRPCPATTPCKINKPDPTATPYLHERSRLVWGYGSGFAGGDAGASCAGFGDLRGAGSGDLRSLVALPV